MKLHNDIRVTFRVDRGLKESAEALFERLGMNMSTALNVFLCKAVDESAIPFPISVKPSPIGYGLSAADVTEAFTTAVNDEIAENTRRGFPIAKYDVNNKQAYLEKADGTREYVNE